MPRLFSLLVFGLCTSAVFSAPAAPKQPNILVIVADDLGYADLGIHGGKEVPTPNIDALATSGVRCTSGYVCSPYCSPSRAGFLTGISPTRFGHEFNPHVGNEETLGLPLDRRTIANHLRDAGYATALFGKWHQGFSASHHPLARGFDEYVGFLVGGHNFVLHQDADPEFGSGHSHNMIYRGRELLRTNGYTTDLFTDETLSFIDRHRQKPWFIYLAYNAVHTPLEVLDKHRSRIPASITDEPRIGYLSLLLGLDDCIGRITSHLKQAGIEKDTLVVFFGDNGGSGHKPYLAYNTGVNAPLRGDKGLTLEGGIRVPFFLSWPGTLPAGQTYDQPVSTLDILPTSCAAAGSQPGTTVEGVNLLPHLQGQNPHPPHPALFWRFGPQKAVRQGQWKLVDWRDFDTKTQSGWQLYDLSQDIGEKNNLAASHPEKVAELEKAWSQWNAQNVTPLWHGSPTEDPTSPPRNNATKAKVGLPKAP